MRKKVLAGLVCALTLCLSFVLVGCAGNKQEESVVSIENAWTSSNGMTVYYPSSWTQEDVSLLKDESYMHPDFDGLLYITSKNLGLNYSAEASPENLKNSAEEYCSGMENSTDGSYKWNVERSYKITDKGNVVSLVTPFSGATNGKTYKGFFYMAISSNHKVHIAMMACNVNVYGENESLMKEVVENIEIDAAKA